MSWWFEWAGSGVGVNTAHAFQSPFYLLSTCDVTHVISFTRPSDALTFNFLLGHKSIRRPGNEAKALPDHNYKGGPGDQA